MKFNIEEIVDKYSKMVFQIAYQNTFIKSNAEDITQDVMIKLWKNIKKIKNEEHLKAWLIRATINASIDSNKSFKTQYEVELDENNEEAGYFDESDVEVFSKLKLLKPVSRNVIYLFYYQGYKTKEIAKLLNMNINTVSTNLSRAKQELRDILEEGGEKYEL